MFMDHIDPNHRPTTTEPLPAKQQNPNNFSSGAIILNFSNGNYYQLNHDQESVALEVSRNEGSSKGGANKGRWLRPQSQGYDHIMAERRRRKQMSQRFLALSAIVPGLKKMDKASVLEDTIKYIKHLQERVITLEEQAANRTMVVNKSQIVDEDKDEDEEEKSSSSISDSHPLPEIEARVSDKSVLLKIQCEKRKGVLVKILSEVEKLNLSVVNISVMRFGSLALDITITAQMDKEISVATGDIVKTLRCAVLHTGGN